MNITPYPTDRIDGTADDCRYPATQRLTAYWRRLMPAGGGLPRWRDVQLMDLYEIAPYLSVKDVLDGGRDFRNRFWGTGLTVVLGFEGSGRLVSTYEPPQMRDAVLRRYAQVVATGTSSLVRGHFATLPQKSHVFFELVHLPLWGDEDRVQHIISAYHFGAGEDDA